MTDHLRLLREVVEPLVIDGLAERQLLTPEQVRETFDAQERAAGQKIKQLRMERSWSQEHLAKLMTEVGYAMYQTTIGKIENGRRPITVGEVAAFCHVFRIPPLSFWRLPVIEDGPLEKMQRELELATEKVGRAELEATAATHRLYESIRERERIASMVDEAARHLSREKGDDGQH